MLTNLKAIHKMAGFKDMLTSSGANIKVLNSASHKYSIFGAFLTKIRVFYQNNNVKFLCGLTDQSVVTCIDQAILSHTEFVNSNVVANIPD